jgi:hypothetical protein
MKTPRELVHHEHDGVSADSLSQKRFVTLPMNDTIVFGSCSAWIGQSRKSGEWEKIRMKALILLTMCWLVALGSSGCRSEAPEFNREEADTASQEAVENHTDTRNQRARKPCGHNFCGPGEYCCNRSCSICAPRGDVCTQRVCAPEPEGEPCGKTVCKVGMVCCNASCGICTPPDGYCTQQVCSDEK